jgi:hypothetical protein
MTALSDLRSQSDREGRGLISSLDSTKVSIEFAKWIVAFGTEKETKIVTATFPKSKSAKLSASLKSVVLTAKNDTMQPPTLGSDVGFKISASPKVKLTRVIGKMLMHT